MAAQERITAGLQDQLALYEDAAAAYNRLLALHGEDEKLTDEQRAQLDAAAAAMQQALARASQMGVTLADNLAIQEAAVRADQDRTAAIEQGNEAERQREQSLEKQRDLQEEQQRQLDEMKEQTLRQQEDQVRALADLYQDLFSGHTGDIWDEFKKSGLRAIAEVAAAWTLAMMTGQSFNPGGFLQQHGAGGDFGPLGTVLSGLFGGGKGGGLPGKMLKVGDLKGMGDLVGAGGGAGGLGGLMGAASSAMPYLAAAAAAATLLSSFGVFKSTKRGSATLGFSGGELGVGSTRGNSRDYIAASSGAMESIIASAERIADMLGGEITGAGTLSIGQRDGKWRLDRTGSGITKTKKGAIDFGDDQEALIRAGVAELIRDGVVGGISDAAKRLLQNGSGDLEKAITRQL